MDNAMAAMLIMSVNGLHKTLLRVIEVSTEAGSEYTPKDEILALVRGRKRFCNELDTKVNDHLDELE